MRAVMRSVPPRGSGWVPPPDIVELVGKETLTRYRVGGTDLIVSAALHNQRHPFAILHHSRERRDSSVLQPKSDILNLHFENSRKNQMATRNRQKRRDQWRDHVRSQVGADEIS